MTDLLLKAGCKAVITADEFGTQNYYDMLTRMVPELKNAKPGNLCSERFENTSKIPLKSCSIEIGYPNKTG